MTRMKQIINSYSFTSGVFYAAHARDFNFELNEEELIKEALQRGFISKVYSTRGTKYTYNPNYKKEDK